MQERGAGTFLHPAGSPSRGFRLQDMREENFMQSATQTAPISMKMLWAGRILSALPALFLLFDAIMKFLKPEPVVKATMDLGFPESVILGLGIVLLACTVLYLIPRTRVEGGLFPIIFPVIFGALLWGGLYLRDGRLRALIPLRS